MPVVKGDSRTMCKCLRCGHAWLTNSAVMIPKKCAKCKSSLWNKPRERAARRMAATMDIVERARRTGPFFRAIKSLAAVDPGELVASIESWQSQDVDPYLEAATGHLQQFRELWHERSR